MLGLSQKLKGWLLVPIPFLIAMLGFLILYDFPKEVDIHYPAVEYRSGDQSSSTSTNIRIKGTLSRPFWRDSRFSGQIIIDSYPFTKSYDLIDIEFNKKILNGIGTLSYTQILNGKPDLQMLGTIWISGDFDKLNIWGIRKAGAAGPSSIPIISAPARTNEEAVSINRLFHPTIRQKD
ncbi:hypothetical protein EJP77_08015 [Paenibacillus zeisoli]|uniref:Uncharacterized protein n=1 Tax=Paenibacillus zeisoli TaxID=2496267 RepID=A0A3S1BUB7_9BACL|nr:hypothetical protein [Paenibacillus zeisoli]RUT33580.1 hypothetical protein EJP77_08015 [Paenibacillus zeisoli]